MNNLILFKCLIDFAVFTTNLMETRIIILLKSVFDVLIKNDFIELKTNQNNNFLSLNFLFLGGYFGYAYSPFTAQQLAAAGLTAAGLPYAATAAQSPAAAGAQQPGQADARIQ